MIDEPTPDHEAPDTQGARKLMKQNEELGPEGAIRAKAENLQKAQRKAES